MSRSTILLATGLIAAAALTACSDATDPVQPELGAAFARTGGDLHVTKDCSQYGGGAGDRCTITTSNRREIAVGSTITYASAAAFPALDTDITIDLPGPGNNAAFGHCTLSLETGLGECTISGGIGQLTGFRARVDVSNVGGANFAWDGSYRFDPRD